MTTKRKITALAAKTPPLSASLTPFVPMTFTARSDHPTLEEAAKTLGIPLTDFDRDFGVVIIDPAKHLYSVMARHCPPPKPDGKPFPGPWSNPTISTY